MSDTLPNGIEVTQDPFTGAVTGERLGKKITEDELREAAEMPRELYQTIKATPNAWPTAMKLEHRDEDGKLVKSEAAQVWNFSLRLDLKPRHDEILASVIKKALLAEIRAETPKKVKRIRVPKSKDGVLCELDIFDPHFMKLAWGPETGTNYDLKLAAEEYRTAAYNLIERIVSRGYKIERWLFPIGQDLFHTDNEDYRTAAGTRQDVDGRTMKAFQIVRRLLTEITNYLLEFAPVDINVTPGNHGPERDWMMGEIIDARFETNPNVRVDNRPIKQKYYRWGNTLLGFAHGKDEKAKDLKDFMTRDCPVDFGETVFREWHLGHLHHDWAIKDMGGVTMRYLPSCSGTDAWHRNAGFFGAQRGARGFVWTKDRGISEIVHYNRIITDDERSFTKPMRAD